MKKAKIIIGLILIFALGFLTGSICNKHFRRRGGPFGKIKPTEMVSRIVGRLTRDLKLSTEQSTQVKAIFLKNHKKIESIKNEMFPQLNAIKQDTLNQVGLLLNEDQKKKFKTIQKRFLKHPRGFPHMPPPRHER